jgi:hypothetical protein
MDKGFRVGARVTFNSWKYFGHEANYAYQRARLDLGGLAKLGDAFSVHNYYYNFLAYGTPRDTVVRPFVTGGAGASSIRGDTKPGFNFGAGLKFKLSERYGLRVDIRDHVTGKLEDFRITLDPGKLHNVEFSAGFSALF